MGIAQIQGKVFIAMKLLNLFFLVISCVQSFVIKSSVLRLNLSLKVNKENDKAIVHQSQLNSKAIIKILSTAFVSSFLLYGPNMNDFRPDAFKITTAHADFRAQQKRTYFRFIPKLEAGRDYFKNELKTAIDNEKWDMITKFFETYVTKYNPNDPSQVDSTDTYVNANLLRPMTVFSGSFAERGSSTKQRLLIEQRDAFAAAMSELEGCIKDRKGEGLFAPDIKMPTGVERKKQALKAWEQGKEAINKYITIANSGLMLELNQIKTI